MLYIFRELIECFSNFDIVLRYITDKASLSSYIRLFEPVVIKALKHYTVTCQVQTQVNYIMSTTVLPAAYLCQPKNLLFLDVGSYVNGSTNNDKYARIFSLSFYVCTTVSCSFY